MLPFGVCPVRVAAVGRCRTAREDVAFMRGAVRRSLVAQGVYRVEGGGFPRGIEAEEDADGGAETEGDDDGGGGDEGGACRVIIGGWYGVTRR